MFGAAVAAMFLTFMIFSPAGFDETREDQSLGASGEVNLPQRSTLSSADSSGEAKLVLGASTAASYALR